MATKHPKPTPRRRREVVTPAEAGRRTRFILGEAPAPTPDQVETLVRQRTSERLSGDLLHEALQGKPDGYFPEVYQLDAYVARAIIRAILPYAVRGLGEQVDQALRDRHMAWITRAQEFIQ
jgi:hypothetical protein